MEVTDLQVDSNRTDKRSVEVSIAIKVKLKKTKKEIQNAEEEEEGVNQEVVEERVIGEENRICCDESGTTGQRRKSSQEYESGFSEGAADDLRSYGSSSYGTDLPSDQDGAANDIKEGKPETDTESVDSAKSSISSSDMPEDLEDYGGSRNVIRLLDIPVTQAVLSDRFVGEVWERKKSLPSSCNSDFDDPISEPIIVFKESNNIISIHNNNNNNKNGKDISSLALPRGTWNDVVIPRVSKLHDFIGDDMARMTGLRGVLFDDVTPTTEKKSEIVVKKSVIEALVKKKEDGAVEEELIPKNPGR